MLWVYPLILNQSFVHFGRKERKWRIKEHLPIYISIIENKSCHTDMMLLQWEDIFCSSTDATDFWKALVLSHVIITQVPIFIKILVQGGNTCFAATSCNTSFQQSLCQPHNYSITYRTTGKEWTCYKDGYSGMWRGRQHTEREALGTQLGQTTCFLIHLAKCITISRRGDVVVPTSWGCKHRKALHRR